MIKINLSPAVRFRIRHHRLRHDHRLRASDYGFPNADAFSEAWLAMVVAIAETEPETKNDTCLAIDATLRQLGIPEFDFRAIAVARLVESVVHSMVSKN